MTVSAAELRRRLVGTAPLSLRAQIVLLLAAALLGAALVAAVFVGVWRRSATESVQAQTAQAQVRHELATTKATLATTRTQLAAGRHALAATNAKRLAAERALAGLRRSDARVANALAPRLRSATAQAQAAAHSASTLASELKSLQGYVDSGGAVDPGFVATQVAYLVRANRDAQAEAAQLLQELDAAAGAAARIGG